MRILVDGARGLLGQEIVRRLSAEHDVTAIDIAELDICDFEAATALVDDLSPEVLIHPAGFRFVDESEQDPDMCYSINALGAKNMAIAADRVGAKMVHISTGAVFDGTLGRPYNEFEEPHPANVYGKSKLMSEQLVRAYCPRHFIVRISLLFGTLGNPATNMVGKLLANLSEGKTGLGYPEDLCFTPTYTKDLADALAMMIQTEAYGTYHVANSGVASRFDLSAYIAEKAGYDKAAIVPTQVKGGDISKNTLLNGLAFQKTFGMQLRDWHEAVDDCLRVFGVNV